MPYETQNFFLFLHDLCNLIKLYKRKSFYYSLLKPLEFLYLHVEFFDTLAPSFVYNETWHVNQQVIKFNDTYQRKEMISNLFVIVCGSNFLKSQCTFSTYAITCFLFACNICFKRICNDNTIVSSKKSVFNRFGQCFISLLY